MHLNHVNLQALLADLLVADSAEDGVRLLRASAGAGGREGGVGLGRVGGRGMDGENHADDVDHRVGGGGRREVPIAELEGGAEVAWGGEGGGGCVQPGQPAAVRVPVTVPGQQDSPGRPDNST